MPVHLKGLILLQVEALPKCQITAAHTINLSLYFLYGQRNEALNLQKMFIANLRKTNYIVYEMFYMLFAFSNPVIEI